VPLAAASAAETALHVFSSSSCNLLTHGKLFRTPLAPLSVNVLTIPISLTLVLVPNTHEIILFYSS
jgi:hypothetical protein